MSYVLIVLCMLFWPVNPAAAQVSIGIGPPTLNIGLNLTAMPDLAQVPGLPVYYAPRLNSNFFFYEGMYWAFQNDNWYASSWYNGPWALVSAEVVPDYILRIPVGYYRNQPTYMRGIQAGMTPRWDEHYGGGWAQQRNGWNTSNRGNTPAAAPLPTYQRQYSKSNYPRPEQQSTIHNQNYTHQPRDTVVRQHYQEHIQTQSQRQPSFDEQQQQNAQRAQRAYEKAHKGSSD